MKCIDAFVNKEKQLLLWGEVVWKGRSSLEMIQSHLMSRKIRHFVNHVEQTKTTGLMHFLTLYLFRPGGHTHL